MDLGAEIGRQLAAHRLEVSGSLSADGTDPTLPPGTRSLLLVSPGPGFWPHLTASPEWQDGKPDPVDRWSRRVIGRVACGLGAKALFPFGGPPWHPFQTWAARSGRVQESPVRLLVHDAQGLWISFRGALALKESLTLPAPPPPPCTGCAAPCLSACPAGALTGAGYDLAACHAWLDSPAGAECMALGCAVRRACPAGAGYDRMAEQSAYHMRQFHRGATTP